MQSVTKTGNVSGTLHRHPWPGYMLPRTCTSPPRLSLNVYADSILNWVGKGVGGSRENAPVET